MPRAPSCNLWKSSPKVLSVTGIAKSFIQTSMHAPRFSSSGVFVQNALTIALLCCAKNACPIRPMNIENLTKRGSAESRQTVNTHCEQVASDEVGET